MQVNLAIAKLLMEESVEEPGSPGVLLNAVPEEIVACNFWLLTAGSAGAFAHQAWYAVDGKPKAIVEAMKSWLDQPRQKKIAKKRKDDSTPQRFL